MVKFHFEKKFPGEVHIYFIVDEGDGKHQYEIQLKKGAKFSPGKIIEPSYIVRETQADEFMKALCEALEQSGFIPSRAVDAELKATRFHLEDMRHLAGVKI